VKERRIGGGKRDHHSRRELGSSVSGTMRWLTEIAGAVEVSNAKGLDKPVALRHLSQPESRGKKSMSSYLDQDPRIEFLPSSSFLSVLFSVLSSSSLIFLLSSSIPVPIHISNVV
jgi:hypothetical protein